MSNHLKMRNKQVIIGMHARGYSNRAIHRETGHHRDTIAEIIKSSDQNGPQVTTGVAHFKCSPGKKSKARSYHSEIKKKIEGGSTARTIHTDLVYEHGFTGSYESIKRYVRKLKKKEPKLVGRMVSGPGQEAQVDFGQGAPIIDPSTGRSTRPNLFVMTLSCSRDHYSEVVWDQKLGTFIRCHINAFNHFGGVVDIVRLDNLKSGISKCEWYDFIENPLYLSFAEHQGFIILPHRPRKKEHKGKVERNIGYIQTALKGKKFRSLQEHNEYLRWWNKQIARQRVHGSTKRQVCDMFEEYDKPALKPLPIHEFEIFKNGTPKVHADGYLQIEQSFYSVPKNYRGRRLEARWTEKAVRIYDKGSLLRLHRKALQKGTYVTHPEDERSHKTLEDGEYRQYLKQKGVKYGIEVLAWIEFMFTDRGVRSYRVIQGLLSLGKKYPQEVINRACRRALLNKVIRYQTLKLLCEQEADTMNQLPLFKEDHEFLRSLKEYQEWII